MKKFVIVATLVVTIGFIQYTSFKASLYKVDGIVSDNKIVLKNGEIHATNGTYKDGQVVKVTLQNVGNDCNLKNDKVVKIIID